MMRQLNPATGKPWPRRGPINWTRVRQLLAARRDVRNLRKRGFVPFSEFEAAMWPIERDNMLPEEAALSADRKNVWVRLPEVAHYYLAGIAEARREQQQQQQQQSDWRSKPHTLNAYQASAYSAWGG